MTTISSKRGPRLPAVGEASENSAKRESEDHGLRPWESIHLSTLFRIKMFRIALILAALSLILNTKYFIPAAFAQLSNVSSNIKIADTEAKPGDILAVYEDGIKRSANPYDQKMYGVVVEFPVLSVGAKGDGIVSVLSSGQAIVNVSTQGGEIKEGDWVTSSTKPGFAQKADAPGYVLGKALAPYNDSSKDGQIPVLVDIGIYTQNPNVGGVFSSMLGNLTVGFGDAKNFPLVLRYIAAAIVTLVTFGISGFSFIRFMRNGLEAIGRNPLARKTIISGMAINGVIVGIITLAGFGIAVAIVAL